MQALENEIRPLMTAAEVAAYHRVTVRTIRNWVVQGVLVPVRRGRTVRFHREDVLADRHEPAKSAAE
jgi:excisionase family DNA binding protein